jgi:pantoate--beta-alanine ligase
MGNLHDGHMSLVDIARRMADRVVMSIFVNPTQFGDGEDYDDYPRTLEDDLTKIRRSGGVDLLFVPESAEIYPFGAEQAVAISMPDMSRELCGAYRPRHFDGVATVVARLLNIVQPHFLVLGRKDYQQLVLVERMVADLHLPVRVVAGDIRREPDGLALSSRNRYLTNEERAIAPALARTLESSAQALREGALDYSDVQSRAQTELESAGFLVDYVEIRDARTLERPNGRHAPEDLVVLAAAWLGKARLIDNCRVLRID